MPVTAGIRIDEPPFTAQWYGHKKIRQDYGPEIVEHLKKMRLFKKIIYPYENIDTADAIIYMSIKGKWSYDNKGRALATFMIGTPNYNDFEGNHEIKTVVKAANDDIANYTISVNTKGQYSGSDGDGIAKELNDLQIKKISVDLANRINADRELIISKVQNQHVKLDTSVQPKTELPQSRVADTDKQLQELGELRKNGVLSEDDYNKAKKRLTETQKLNELRQSGVLSEEEYNKAKARLKEK